MAVFDTTKSNVLMPRNIADGMITRSQSLSTVAQLSGQEPQKFGNTDYITFDDFPRAEFVEEGADKGSTTGSFGVVTAKPHKAQVTMRFNQEVMWADEDYQLHVLEQLGSKGAESLSRALDLGLYHRINPLTGAPINSWDNYVTATKNKATQAAKTDADQTIREAAGLLIQQDVPVQPTGIAMDPRLTWDLANLQTKNADGTASGLQRYPQLGLGSSIDSFLGLQVAQGNTVSGQPEAADTGVRGIIGDFQSGIRWGIQRDLPLELIQYGDPDGQGDLKRKNQVALRLEIVYGWYVFADRFATISTATKAA